MYYREYGFRIVIVNDLSEAAVVVVHVDFRSKTAHPDHPSKGRVVEWKCSCTTAAAAGPH